MKLKVPIHPAEEGGSWAEAPALPGCVSEGDTFAETLDNIREAALGWLEAGEGCPLPTAKESLRRGWDEALRKQTHPITELWSAIETG